MAQENCLWAKICSIRYTKIDLHQYTISGLHYSFAVFILFSLGYSWPLEALETFNSLLTNHSNLHLGFKTGSNHPITDEKKSV